MRHTASNSSNIRHGAWSKLPSAMTALPTLWDSMIGEHLTTLFRDATNHPETRQVIHDFVIRRESNYGWFDCILVQTSLTLDFKELKATNRAAIHTHISSRFGVNGVSEDHIADVTALGYGAIIINLRRGLFPPSITTEGLFDSHHKDLLDAWRLLSCLQNCEIGSTIRCHLEVCHPPSVIVTLHIWV